MNAGSLDASGRSLTVTLFGGEQRTVIIRSLSGEQEALLWWSLSIDDIGLAEFAADFAGHATGWASLVRPDSVCDVILASIEVNRALLEQACDKAIRAHLAHTLVANAATELATTILHRPPSRRRHFN